MGNDRTAVFLKAKISKQLSWYGETYSFTHQKEDKYHRGTEPVVHTLTGVYHQSTSYSSKNTKDGSVTTSKAKPMILCLYDDGKNIVVGDRVKINSQDMIVSGIDNIQQLNVGLQISLEVNE